MAPWKFPKLITGVQNGVQNGRVITSASPPCYGRPENVSDDPLLSTMGGVDPVWRAGTGDGGHHW